MTSDQGARMPESRQAESGTEWVSEAIAQAVDTILVTDQRDRIAYVSDSIADLVGVESSSLLGESVLAVVRPEDHSQMLDALRLARFGDEPGAQMLALEFAGAQALRPVQVEVTVCPAVVGGKTRGCICVARDASTSKAHFDERVASERVAAIVGLAKEAAHQINNPLAILTVHLGVIERAAAEGKCAQPEAIDQMRKVVHRIAEVTSDLAAAANTSIQKSILGASVADLRTTPSDIDPK